jgi:aspartate kinase
MKFGGSSVGTTAALTQVLSILIHESKRWDRLIVVVSALDGVTDALIEATHLAQINNGRGYRRIAATLRTRHLALIEKLPLGANERAALSADIDRLLFDLLNLYQNIANQTPDVISAELLDTVVGVGEKLAARIVAALLRQNDLRGVALDTTDLIITDDGFGNAIPNLELTRQRVNENLLPMLDRQIIPVLTGFIGGTRDGKPTTLGRGGSDYTASILAMVTGANEVWVWTDVEGIMTADPREISEARAIPELTYEETAELAYFGARVLHQRMVAPLRENRILLRVKNVYKPVQGGTLISEGTRLPPALRAVTRIQGIMLAATVSGSLSAITEIIDDVLVETIGVRAEVLLASQSSQRTLLSFVIPTSAGIDMGRTVERSLQARLTEKGLERVWSTQQIAFVTAVGTIFDGSHHMTARILQALGDIRILSIGQSPAWCGVSLAVNARDGDTALQRIHDLVISSA